MVRVQQCYGILADMSVGLCRAMRRCTMPQTSSNQSDSLTSSPKSWSGLILANTYLDMDVGEYTISKYYTELTNAVFKHMPRTLPRRQ